MGLRRTRGSDGNRQWRRVPAAILAGTGLTVALVAANGGGSQPVGTATKARAATLVGAFSDTWAQTNSLIGPLQTSRVFYHTNLPTSFIGSTADQLPAGIVAIVSYKQVNTNVVSFVNSIPANRQVIMSFHHEPEGGLAHGDFANGPQFVSAFDSQSALIRSLHRSNVRIAMIAGSYQYAVGTHHDNGGNAAYLPATSEVDMYCVDNYETNPNGAGMGSDPNFLGWYNQVKDRGKPLCITEYGVNSDNTASGNALRAATMKADNNWLIAHGNFLIWEYWWNNVGLTTAQAIAAHTNWVFTDSPSINEWKAIEAGGGTPPPTPTPRPTSTPTGHPTPTPTAHPTPTPTPPPAVASSLTLSAATLHANGTDNVTIAFHLNVDATVTVTVRNARGAVARTVLDSVAKPAGDRSQAYYGYDGSGRPLQPGTYTVVVTATGGGHTATLTAHLTVTR